jgi:sulfur-oxidizing protein SoxX
VSVAAAIVAAWMMVGVAYAADAIPDSLTGAKGDAARGRAIVTNRHVGPDLAGAGTRWSEGQLRLRIADSSRVNPATIMPSYHRTEGLTRVAPAWRGKPVLTPEQIEDVVAFLMTLKD